MTRDASLRTLALVLAVPLLTAGMAGCVGTVDDESNAPWSSYEDAKAAQGPTFEPNGTDDPTRIKWLRPQTPDSVPQGQSEIWMLLYDSEADEPITDATVTMGSYMPAMGHGTSAEEDPTHQDFGVYRGVINPSMGGSWQLNVTMQLASGQTLDFVIEYKAEGGGMDHGDGHGGHDHGHGNKTNETDGNETVGNETDGNETTVNETEEPEGFNATFNDTLEAETDYQRDWTFPVNSTNFTVEASITFNATDPTAEANLTLIDANGTQQATVNVTADDGEATLTIEEPPVTGEYTARVAGTALDANYALRIDVA